MNSEADLKSSKAYRRARLAVIILTTLLVMGMVALVIGFARIAGKLMVGRASGVATAADKGPAALVTLAPGARIVSAGTDAGKLVLHVTTPSGGEVEIIDLATGKLTGQVKTAPGK